MPTPTLVMTRPIPNALTVSWLGLVRNGRIPDGTAPGVVDARTSGSLEYFLVTLYPLRCTPDGRASET